MYIKSTGSWKSIQSFYIKVSGVWKAVNAGYIKVSGTWKQFFGAATAPGQVTGLTATDFGTSRSYNSGRIDLSWTAPSDGGSPITGYFIERSLNGVTYSTLVSNTGTTSTTYTDTGLTSAQTYYYRVSAINAVGTGTASSAANATATTVPQTPTVTASVSSSTQVSLSFSGATGGKALSSLTITSSPSISLSYSGTSSPITVTGSYAVNQAYTFTMSATNANGTSGTSAASNSVTPNALSAPVNTVAPVVTPSSGTAGTTTYSSTTGSWNNSPTSYSYQWQSFDTPTYITAPGTSTNSTYTPPSNFFTLGYSSPIRCRVTATNAAGSTQAFSNTVTVSAPLSPPSGGSVTLSGTGVVGTSITATTTGWSNSPTSYSVRIYASTSNPPTTSDVLKVTNSPSSSNSVSYTVTTFDASPPPYYFKAFATATNSAGTSSEVGSTVILSSLGVPSTPGTPVLTYDPGGNTLNNYNYDADWSDSSGSGTIVYQLDCQPSSDGSTPNGQPNVTRPSSGTYSTSDAQNFKVPKVTGGVSNLFWRVRARASNDGGSSWTGYSSYSNWE
jgi:titin